MSGPLPAARRPTPRVATVPVAPAVAAADGAALAELAAAAVAAHLAGHPLAGEPPAAAALREPGATFVTLHAGGGLRGCVGTLEPVRPRYQDVLRNAVRAAVDPRFPPVTADDWPVLAIRVSVLSPLADLPAGDRARLLATLRPAVDGLVLAGGGRRATFLPRVWAQLPDPAGFVDALLVKGGWPATRWPAGLTAHRYTTVEFPAAHRTAR